MVDRRPASRGGTLTTEYRYHHGYWDGVEREFRGFAMVEQLDTETFDRRRPAAISTTRPPTLTKTWFHLGPVAAAEARRLGRARPAQRVLAGDPPQLDRPAGHGRHLLASCPAATAATACGRCAGRLLRTELYALDGHPTGSGRPYTVTEALAGMADPRRCPRSPVARRDRDRTAAADLLPLRVGAAHHASGNAAPSR